MALEKEMEVYKNKLPELRDQEGRFALIHGDALVDVFGTYEDALSAGYKQFGLDPFLVQQIQAVAQVQFVSRLLDPACLT